MLHGSIGPDNTPIDIKETDELIERVEDCLVRRATQSNMELVIDVPDEAKSKLVIVSPDSVERILFNLVDNACKYATTEDAGDRRIHRDATGAAARTGRGGPGGLAAPGRVHHRWQRR